MKMNRNTKVQHIGSSRTFAKPVLYEGGISRTTLSPKHVKENLCKQLALKWKDEIDERLFNAMMNWQIHQI